MSYDPNWKEGEPWYMNFYRCPHCKVKWQDDWSCMCNDKCPECDAEIEPYRSKKVKPQ